MKKYAMIQIHAQIHQVLKEFCKEKGLQLQTCEIAFKGNIYMILLMVNYLLHKKLCLHSMFVK